MDDPGEPNDTEDNSVGTWSGTLGFPYWLNQQCKKKIDMQTPTLSAT